MSTPLFIREPAVGAKKAVSTDSPVALFDTVDEATLIEEIAYSVNVADTVDGVIKPFLEHSAVTYNLPLIDVAAPAGGKRASGRVTVNVVVPVGWTYGFTHDLEVSAPGDAQLTVIAMGGILR